MDDINKLPKEVMRQIEGGVCAAGFPITDAPCPECGAVWNERCGRYDYSVIAPH